SAASCCYLPLSLHDALPISQKGWIKYAGNWKQKDAPVAYRFQTWLLERQSRPVTINGRWPNQPKHCLSYENPCLTKQELDEGQRSEEHTSELQSREKLVCRL